MSGYEASAPLTGTLLSSKGAAAPSNSVTSLMDDFAVEALAAVQPRIRPTPSSHDNPGSGRRTSAGVHQENVRAVTPPGPKENTAATQERIKLSLRLSTAQHLRLKLAAAHLRVSSQVLLMTALDDYLAKAAPAIRDGECRCLMSGTRKPPAPCRGEYCGHAG
jgi:hypothetical protein